MDSLVLIERLDELMAEAKPIPFTREARVDRDEVYKILDRIRTTLPVEFERARWTGREDSQEDAVETQLRQLGASIAELRRAQRTQNEQPSGPPLTAAASEQVREIVEAAERTATELEQTANAEAAQMRAEAARELKSARDEAEQLRSESRERASADAAAYLRRVEEATQKMLERAADADSEINGMLARLRGSGGSVIEDLEAIMTGLTQIEVRRNGAPKEEPARREERVPAKAEAGAAVRVPDDEGATVAAVAVSPQTRPAAAPSTRPAAPMARRPVRTDVEGLQEPPEAPAIRPHASAAQPAPEAPGAMARRRSAEVPSTEHVPSRRPEPTTPESQPHSPPPAA